MIIVKRSSIQFRNPETGQPTRSVEQHYDGRVITASLNGEETILRFKKNEMPFNVTEEEMVRIIGESLEKNNSQTKE